MRWIQPTSNINMIKLVLKDFYDQFVFDDSPELGEFNPTGAWFILREQRESVGIINLQPLNNVTYIPHIYIKDKYRGEGSEEWGKQVIDFMGKTVRYLAITPYEPAKKYAEKLGFKYVSTLKESIKKNGKLLDQYVLEK